MADLHIPEVAGLQGRRCLVTGGAGFIGSTLTRVLLRSGADVVVLDNLATGDVSNLDCRDEIGRVPEVVLGDVRESERLARVLRQGDIVFHLACLGVRHSIHSPLENADVNGRGAMTVLSAARAAGAQRVVHVSSSEVYGTARFIPMTEAHPAEPHTVYGSSKLAGECYARSFYYCYGLPVVVIRPFNAYGPRSHFEGDSGEVLPRFVLRACAGLPLVVFGDGTQTRDLTHVYDTATAIARAAVAPGVEGRTFNVGSGRELAINELASVVRQVLGKPDLAVEHVDRRPGDVLRLMADSSEAARALGFRPAVTLQDGVADLVKRFRSLPGFRLEELASGMVVRNWE